MPCTKNMTHDPGQLLKVKEKSSKFMAIAPDIQALFLKKLTRIAKKEREKATQAISVRERKKKLWS